MAAEGAWTAPPATVSVTSNFLSLNSFYLVILSGGLASIMPNALIRQRSNIPNCQVSTSECFTIPLRLMIFFTDSSERPSETFWWNMLVPATFLTVFYLPQLSFLIPACHSTLSGAFSTSEAHTSNWWDLKPHSFQTWDLAGVNLVFLIPSRSLWAMNTEILQFGCSPSDIISTIFLNFLSSSPDRLAIYVCVIYLKYFGYTNNSTQRKIKKKILKRFT